MSHNLHLLFPCLACVLMLKCRGARTGEPPEQPTLSQSSAP